MPEHVVGSLPQPRAEGGERPGASFAIANVCTGSEAAVVDQADDFRLTLGNDVYEYTPWKRRRSGCRAFLVSPITEARRTKGLGREAQCGE
ncbi:hypothetical protein M2232_002320 [Bradyrhizobium japonicum]|nr:hypothetical protein [Bradyrhizobium japonicum]MCW2343402.1 hypothetical protein [Bradyrhizobium japonicum]